MSLGFRADYGEPIAVGWWVFNLAGEYEAWRASAQPTLASNSIYEHHSS